MSNYDKLKLTYEDGRQDSIILTSDTIESGAYQRQHIVSVEVPEIVKVIGNYAFCDNNNLANIVLNEGLEGIEGQAFQHGVYTAITIPSTVRYIGVNSFNISLEQHEGLDSFTITCLATTPPELEDFEGITFGYRSCISAIYVPDGSVSAYQEAWRDYADKIQGGAHPSYMFTNLDISAAYVGIDAVAKVYLGSDIVWELAPSDPCEGLTGESLCNCQGRYWWGGECHDEPEPEPVSMESIPLTFEITSVGTGKTGIGLRLSGDTSESNKRKVTYYLYHEGTEKKGTLSLIERPSNSAVTSEITGLTVGDKIEFWGLNDQRGLSVSGSAFEYFVVYPEVTAKVYGNINSLLYNGTTYHGQPVPQTGETDAYAFYRLFTGKSGFTFGAPDEPQHIVLPVPANGLQGSIYQEMFKDCKGLTVAPKLPATTLAPSCYRSMFNGAGLTTAPELPAISLKDSCYNSMFAGCTSLAQAPELPATTLANGCYYSMFAGCTSLTKAPELPVTTLANSCYGSMFAGCTSLTQAPVLPAEKLIMFCYNGMFSGCTNLNYIKCLTTNPKINIFATTSRWVQGVSAAGTFVKHPDATWTKGESGIPIGWTVEDAVFSTGHTASVLLNESVSVDLPETSPDIYDMVFSEPYTSITLYYDNQVVTASTLSITIEGGEAVANKTDFEVANINVDTYGGTSINAITFNADTKEVYIDFAA